MPRPIVSPALLCCALVVLAGSACSRNLSERAAFDAAAVAAEIEQALRAEIAAFENRDCAAALDFFGDREPLFVVGGRTMPRRADLAAACPGMTARIPEGATRPVASESVYATSAESGYSVTEFRIPVGPAGRPTSQFVTKVWAKTDGAWRIVHVHESVAPPEGP